MGPNQTTTFKACPVCGQTLDLAYTQCPRCGHVFQTQYVPPNNQTQQFSQPPAGYPRPGYPPQGYYQGGVSPQTRLVVTLVLWFFLGGFGAHRFYLGHTSSAVTMLVLQLVGIATACILVGYPLLLAVWIWWIVDLVQMLTGNLRFADGSPLLT